MKSLRDFGLREFRRIQNLLELEHGFRTAGIRRNFITATAPSRSFETRTGRPFTKPYQLHLPRTSRPTRPQTRHNSSKQEHPSRPSPDPTPNLGSPELDVGSGSLSLSQRMRKLSREYGWSAVAVYFALSALDFPFCFIAVRALGTDRIGHWEHIIVGYAWRVATLDGRIGQSATSDPHDGESVGEEVEGGSGLVAVSKEGGKILEQANEGQGWTWGVDEAEKANRKTDATIWTQLALAYAIHKSFIFLRIPLTAAVTPKVVKVLRGWGWDIGKRKPKTIKASNNINTGK